MNVTWQKHTTYIGIIHYMVGDVKHVIEGEGGFVYKLRGLAGVNLRNKVANHSIDNNNNPSPDSIKQTELVTMHLTILISLLPLVTAITTPVERSPLVVAEPLPTDKLTARGLEKRYCDEDFGCECVRGLAQGQYCGACRLDGGFGAYVITKRRYLNYIYECNPQGGCCSYGPADDCNTGHGRCG